MTYTIAQIASALGAQALGNSDIEVDGVAEPADASARDLALAMNAKYAETLGQGQARAAIVWEGADWQALGLEAAIIAPRPRYVMSGLTSMMDPGQGWEAGIHPSAIIHDTAKLGKNVTIGPLTIIGRNAVIGDNCVIGPQCHIGADSTIGNNANLREAVRIGARVTIGQRFFAQPGAVIGGDGFSFVTPEKSNVEQARQTLGDSSGAQLQSWTRIHSLGGVCIGDDVDVGANCTIDSGTIRATRVGNGTKIDNMVMVAHNVEIGNDCLLCGHAGVAGSSKIGNNVVMGGQSGISDNIFVGDNVVLGGGTVVLSNIPSDRVMLGYPAMKMDSTIEMFKGLRRLKRLFGDVTELKKTVSNLGKSD